MLHLLCYYIIGYIMVQLLYSNCVVVQIKCLTTLLRNGVEPQKHEVVK